MRLPVPAGVAGWARAARSHGQGKRIFVQENRIQENRVIQGAFLISLLLHVLLAVATWRLPLHPRFHVTDTASAQDEIEVVLLPPEAAPAAERQADQVAAEQKDAAQPPLPTAYTEIPDRQASAVPPEQADYLALHHSLAADNVLGGDSRSPKADEEWVTDQVQIQQEDLQGAQGVVYAPQVAVRPKPAGDPAGQADGQADGQAEGQRSDQAQDRTGDQARAAAEPADPAESDRRRREVEPPGPAGQWALAEPAPATREPAASGAGPQIPKARGEEAGEPAALELQEWWQEQPPSILAQGETGAGGDRGFDFNQLAKGKVASGVAIDGDFSLNTYEWDYAPWMHRFTNELYRHWIPPYAYKLGILDGRTVIRLVVAKSGRVEAMDVVDTQGHESLHEASVAALQAFAPYAPLPPHFPEENLVITLGLYYPAPRR